jgi:3D (Asp-Asp-Asp) domain-containing protein/predicted small lipoprotein YifL
MRHAQIMITALTLLVTSLTLPGCAGTKGPNQLADAAATSRASKKKPEEAAIGRLDDPSFLFASASLAPSKSVRVKALAYTGCSVNSKKRAPRGAWGDALTADSKAVAVSPDLLDMGLDRGDVISIEGLPGQYKVLDVMHGRHDKTIDIFYGDDRCGAMQWGKRTLNITWQ